MVELFKRNKKYLIFVGLILLVGLCSGIIYYFLLNSEIKGDISNTIQVFNNFRYNSIIKDLIIMSILLITSFFIVGIPGSLFYLFYEGLSLGLILSVFSANFGMSGFFYFLLYFFINKFLPLLLMIFFIKKLICISRLVIGLIIYKRDNQIKNKIVLNLRNSLYLIVFVLLLNALLYWITPGIFSNFEFLLK